jgi:hypothetical protein
MSVAEPGGGSAGFRWRPPTQMRQAPTKRTGVGSFTLDRYSSSTREDRVHLELGSASRGSRRRRQRPARYQCLSAQASNGIWSRPPRHVLMVRHERLWSANAGMHGRIEAQMLAGRVKKTAAPAGTAGKLH